jgi:Ni/Co efflux regulator RcnB
MSKLLSTLLAAVFAAVTITPVAFAADKKEEAKKEMKKGEGKKTEGKKEAKKGEDKKKEK